MMENSSNSKYRLSLIPLYGMLIMALPIVSGCGSDTPASSQDKDPKVPLLSSVFPDNGLATTTQTVILTGTGFSDTDTVSIGQNSASCTLVDSTSLECTFPANGGIAEVLDISVDNGSGNTSTLTAAFTYTGVNLGAVDFCNIQAPYTSTTSAGVTTENIYGQVYVAGLTDIASTPAPIVSQLGYGADGSDPTIVNFIWVDGAINPGYDFTTNNDEHMATLTISTVGVYDYAFRFTLDNINYAYCDTNGPSDGYSHDMAGSLVIT
ncbi:MAG: IPT/TIG domain-containing protein [Deltaproteobacteria bacterium]|nr:IPT/TIG domain-containing protein [Deltaproteobacteria bacterium]